MTGHPSGRLIAWAAFTLGVAASVAANVAHARPELGPRLASAFAPVALLLTVEIMSRVPWPAGGWWKLGRFAGTGTVALVAAVMSYRHMYALLLSYGEDNLNASIGPLAVDGLMVVASLALLALGNHPQPTAVAPGDHTTTVPASGETSSTEPVPADPPAGLMMSANLLAAQHHNSTGQPITVATLADQLGVDHHTARRLLTGSSVGSDTPPARINGYDPVKVAAT